MNKKLVIFFLSAVLVLWWSKENYSQVKSIKHIIIFGVDGMSPDGIRHASKPNMEYLMKNGAYTMHGRAVLPTVSSPNWESIISGAEPMQHGVTSNEWEVNDFILPPVTTGMEKIFPTIFGVLREQVPGAEIGAIYHWEGFGRLFEKSAVNYDVHGEDQFKTTTLAADYIKSKKPMFTFIHLDHVDDAGHTFGHGSQKYYNAVTLADSLLGVIIQAAKDGGIYDSTLFIVCADHGGVGFGHGGISLAEDEVPFILFGPGVKHGYEIKTPFYQYDNAATVAFVFGLNPPYAWIGRPVKNAFEGYPDPEIKNEKELLDKPVIYPERKFYSPPGGLFIDTYPEVKMSTDEKGAQIRYTIDGSEPTQSSSLYIEPFKVTESKVITAKVFMGQNEESYPEQAYFTVIKSNEGHGLNYNYYEVDNLEYLPVFDKLTPVKSGTVYQSRNDKIEHRHENYALSFKGYIKIKEAGEYRFYTYSDDGSQLFIDGEKVVDNDGDHGTVERSGEIKLSKGMHAINITYFNGGGGQWLDAFYRGPGVPKQIIPADVLYLNN